LQNIYNEGELDKEATLSILETVQKEGNREAKRKREYYNLDAIIIQLQLHFNQSQHLPIYSTQCQFINLIHIKPSIMLDRLTAQ